MNRISPLLLYMASLVSVSIFFAGCQDDPTERKPLSNTEQQNIKVNDWIHENMEYWYLWDSELATNINLNQNPADYFEALLYREDRFSWIQENYQELLNSLKGVNKEAGYEYILYRDKQDNNLVIAQIVYVKPQSPAEQAGLVRGDVISHINETRLTIQNYQELIGRAKENHTIRYKSTDVETETYSEEKTVSLTTVEYSENPNFMNKVLEIDGHKIGYYVYNLFAGGPNANSNVYDTEMDQVFASFKSQGITDLVVDLRFNTGGAENSANNLASLIGVGVNGTKIFARKQYNQTVQEVILETPSMGEDFLNSKFTTKTANVGNLLSNGRVYILTSRRSASASELVINALKPYMDVFIVGDTTYGKNVGSISLYEAANKDNTWGMQPIVVKVANRDGQSDYSNGFAPNVYYKDNSMFVYPLGDPREALLGQAIGQITGNATTGRAASVERREIIGHSLDHKRSSFNLIVEDFRK